MKIIALILFLFLFLVYSFGVSPSVFGGDSGDIILASWFGGVAHPPGYPLNSMIGWIFTHLPYPASVAFKANLMAAFFMAAVAAILFLIVQNLTKNIFVALACSLTLAFNPLFLLYAHVIEVFQLNLVLVGLSVLFLLTWREVRKEIYFFLSFVFLGLSVFHHHTSVLIVPAYAYLILNTDKKILRNKKLLIMLVCGFFLGLLPYIFIPFAAFRKTPINWDDASNIANFIKLITRADYGTFVAATDLVGSDLMTRLLQFKSFFLFFKSDFTNFGVVLVLIGAMYAFLRHRQIFYFTLIAFVFTGPFFLFYASFPIANNFYLGLWERFILLPYFFIGIFLAFGFLAIEEFLKKYVASAAGSKVLKNEAKRMLLGGILLLFSFYLYFANSDKADLSNFNIGDWLGYDTLISAQPNSIILTFADTPTFNSQYIFYTQNNPNRIKLVLGGQLRHLEYRRQTMRSYPDLVYPQDFLDDDESDSSKYIMALVNANIEDTPIYSTGHAPHIDGYKWMKVGLLKQLLKSENYNVERLINSNSDIFQKFKYKDFSAHLGYGHFMLEHIQAIYYASLIDLSDELIINEKEDVARIYLNNAVSLAPESKESYVRLGNIALNNNLCGEARDNYAKAYSIDINNWMLAEVLGSVYKDCFKNDGEAQIYFDDAARLKRILEKPL